MAKVKGEKPGVKSKYLHAKFGGVIDYGFTSVPKLLIKHADKFPELTDQDYWFIVQILYAQDEAKGRHNGFIKDDDFSILSTRKTLQRFRKRIQEVKDENGNQLIKIDSVYFQDENGNVGCPGTCYNFKEFFNYLVKLEFREDTKSHRGKRGKNQPKGHKVPSEDKMFGETENDEQKGASLDIKSHINIDFKEFKNYKETHYDFKKTVSYLKEHFEADPKSDMRLEGNRLIIRHRLPDVAAYNSFIDIIGLRGEIQVEIIELKS